MDKKRLKIAICINGRAHEGGMTTVVNTAAKALREQGHRVDVITIFGTSPYREVKPNLIKYTDKTLKNRPFLTITAYLLSKVILAFHLYWNFILKNYDAILAMDMSSANISYPLKKFLKIYVLNFPLGAPGELIDQGKIKENSWAQKYIHREYKKAIERSDLNVCSPFHLGHIKKITHNPAPLIFLHCAPLDRNLFYKEKEVVKQKIKKRMGIPKDKFLLLFVGRLAPRKGPEYLLSAFKTITKKNYNCLLFYVGSGPEEKKLRDEVKKSNLKNSVKFLGTVPHAKVTDFYKIADCFIFTSFVKNGVIEPFSNSTIEAMACGLPIVAFSPADSSLQSQYKRVLRNNYNSILVPEKDIDALAKAIEIIYNNPVLRRKLSEGSLKEIREGGYYAQHFAKNIEKIINQLINKRK
jgi:glycosyltransferase involved in cell wall biosynthesis